MSKAPIPKWKDTSSRSRGQEDQTPTEWTLEFGRIRMTIHHHIHYPKGMWLLSVHGGMEISRMELGIITAEEAQKYALELVIKKLEVMLIAAQSVEGAIYGNEGNDGAGSAVRK